jgi:hypothetical protein
MVGELASITSFPMRFPLLLLFLEEPVLEPPLLELSSLSPIVRIVLRLDLELSVCTCECGEFPPRRPGGAFANFIVAADLFEWVYSSAGGEGGRSIYGLGEKLRSEFSGRIISAQDSVGERGEGRPEGRCTAGPAAAAGSAEAAAMVDSRAGEWVRYIAVLQQDMVGIQEFKSRADAQVGTPKSAEGTKVSGGDAGGALDPGRCETEGSDGRRHERHKKSPRATTPVLVVSV